MPDLLVDTDTLRSLDEALKLIVATLDGAEGMSRSTADASGNGELAGRLIDFADDWEDNREDMLDAVRTVSDAIHFISEGFEMLDQDLVQKLLGNGR
ncbi:hypothetical protein GCM10010988_07920 [Cnuibacter physcomitrellae]|uniref:Uncharacterized protein n=1 Tax=Cnuibacter physcomitrellae TaxID=1619308 RepID=A0A1X9LKD9_9MICO|nr:hypothetical protein [Cnuibacter physcomitrellae]ARJ05675.1 hypothetical protein B5808_10910 [Cnuibacter physcomitrellae]GGI36232.1 hypothetical protein GCM10010988_07920 [Cnuibacter physcomitrellae]